MHPLHLRLAEPATPWRILFGYQGGRLAQLAALALALAAGLLALQVASAWRLHQALAVARAAQPRPAAPAPSPARPGTQAAARELPKAHLSAWTEAVHRLNAPWPAVLDTLESLSSDDVAVLALEPDAQRGQLRLQLEGRSLAPLLQHGERLRRAAGVTQLVLRRHDTLTREAAQPVRLTLVFDPGLLPAPVALPAAPAQEGP